MTRNISERKIAKAAMTRSTAPSEISTNNEVYDWLDFAVVVVLEVVIVDEVFVVVVLLVDVVVDECVVLVADELVLVVVVMVLVTVVLIVVLVELLVVDTTTKLAVTVPEPLTTAVDDGEFSFPRDMEPLMLHDENS